MHQLGVLIGCAFVFVEDGYRHGVVAVHHVPAGRFCRRLDGVVRHVHRVELEVAGFFPVHRLGGFPAKLMPLLAPVAPLLVDLALRGERVQEDKPRAPVIRDGEFMEERLRARLRHTGKAVNRDDPHMQRANFRRKPADEILVSHDHVELGPRSGRAHRLIHARGTRVQVGGEIGCIHRREGQDAGQHVRDFARGFQEDVHRVLQPSHRAAAPLVEQAADLLFEARGRFIREAEGRDAVVMSVAGIPSPPLFIDQR